MVFWFDDVLFVLCLSLSVGLFLLFRLFVDRQDTFQVWEKLKIQAKLHSEAKRSIANIDTQHILQQVDQRHQAELGGLPLTTPAEHTTFVLSEYSLPVCRSLWRIVEYVLIDFVDFWWLKISDSPEFGNDLRDVFDHAFNVLAERCIKVDWSPFIVKNVISNLNYLMRIYRLTEQGQWKETPEVTAGDQPRSIRLTFAIFMFCVYVGVPSLCVCVCVSRAAQSQSLLLQHP